MFLDSLFQCIRNHEEHLTDDDISSLSKLRNQWAYTRLMIEYGEGRQDFPNLVFNDVDDPLINEDLIRVNFNFQNAEEVCGNLYTFVLANGCYVAPYDWIYANYYYDKVGNKTYYRDPESDPTVQRFYWVEGEAQFEIDPKTGETIVRIARDDNDGTYTMSA